MRDSRCFRRSTHRLPSRRLQAGMTLIELGISSLAGAAMIHAGATVFDHMPHGSFFHATGGSVHMGVGERLKLIPYETAVGLTIATVSTLMFGVFGLA